MSWEDVFFSRDVDPWDIITGTRANPGTEHSRCGIMHGMLIYEKSDQLQGTSILIDRSQEILLPLLSNIRLEARRVGREDMIDEAIAQLEARTDSDLSS